MCNWKIPLFKIYWDNDDVEAVSSVIKQGGNWALGQEIKEFEDKIAEYIGVKYAVAVNSGTSALYTVLLANGIEKGDEVIVPSFTFIATVNAVKMTGATPVFADIEMETFGLDLYSVVGKLLEDVHRKIKAVVAVNYGGQACSWLRKLKETTKERHLLLIEDNAPSFGALVGYQKTGSIGDSSILSFCSAKTITTGEGGMVLTNNMDVYEKAKLIRSHGRAETTNYFDTNEIMDYITLGYNFRMSTMTAALGLSQLKKIDKIINLRQENAEYLTNKLKYTDSIITPKSVGLNTHVYNLYTIRVRDGKYTREALRKYLESKGIFSKVYFNPIHLTKFYKNTEESKIAHLPVTNRISDEVLSLPMSPVITHEELEEVANNIKEFYASGR